MKKNRPLKILFVAFSESVHTARWISQIADQGWGLHLFSSHDKVLPYPGFKNITHHQFFRHEKIKDYLIQNPSIKFVGPNIFSKLITIYLIICKRFMPKVFKTQIQFLQKKGYGDYQVKHLCYLIKKLQPDIIHSMEFQSAGYLVLEAKKNLEGKFPFPKWIATNWGSDIYLFGRLKKHQSKIREILRECDYYSCECQRDVCLAENLGLDRRKALPVLPNSGGFDLKKVKKLRQNGKISDRRLIVLKGHQGLFGRMLVGLRSLENCTDLLKAKKYRVALFTNAVQDDVSLAVKLFITKTGIPTDIYIIVPHEKILKLHGQAKISIGLSISDAISTSLLEAMAMGSFPIQSWTACADEWIKDGVTGLLVPPEDPDIIEKAIRKAILDDKLVNSAARENWQTVKKRLEYNQLKKETINFYKKAMKEL